MATFTGSDGLRGSAFRGADLREARFVECNLSGVVMRGVEIQRAEIDSPWLFDGDNVLLVNGVDVLPFVDAELNRRFPGRADRMARDPAGLQDAWAALERSWAVTVDRAARMPAGALEASVAGEWSFTQTLRHLILATDMWLGQAVLEQDEPFHPIGLMDVGSQSEANAPSAAEIAPSFDEVLEVRADRVAAVRSFLAAATTDALASNRQNPHNPDSPETVLSCLHTILEEEWEHLRYAVRDLDTLDATKERP